jgi:hypothetical protein
MFPESIPEPAPESAPAPISIPNRNFIENQTEKLHMDAIKAYGQSLIYYIEEEEKPENICIQAVKENNPALIYVGEEPENICIQAIKELTKKSEANQIPQATVAQAGAKRKRELRNLPDYWSVMPLQTGLAESGSQTMVTQAGSKRKMQAGSKRELQAGSKPKRELKNLRNYWSV